MSLELKIEALTAAVIALTAKIESGTVTPANVAIAGGSFLNTASVNQPQEQRLAPIAAPVAVVAPVAAPIAAPVMPAAPTFDIPQAITQIPQNGAPFTDPKGLIDFVMTSYKNLGPAKGAGIQGVLTGLGYQNINDVKAEHYAALFCGIESLKG